MLIWTITQSYNDGIKYTTKDGTQKNYTTEKGSFSAALKNPIPDSPLSSPSSS
jgi:hypothetical protein